MPLSLIAILFLLVISIPEKTGTMAQTQNANAVGSCNPSHLENLLYFSYLFEEDDDVAQPECKRAKRELKEFSKLPPPLGVRLTITPSLVQLIEEKLSGAAEARTPCQEPPKKVDKLKAVHLPMCSLMIGFYLIEAQYPAHLVAKFYFAKRKLVWEILDKGLKHKIEIQWQNISAIRASIEENKPGNLEIELDTVPSFFRETTPQPRKHTVWTTSSDFTGGYASQYRRHSLQFPHGVLNQHYLKLLQLDKRLLGLSRAPFPSFESGYFDSYLDQGTKHIHFGHNDLHAQGSSATPASEQPIVDPPLLSTQQVKPYCNAMPMPFSAMNDLTSPSSASEHQQAFDPLLISTQQVPLSENRMPNDPTSLSSACHQQTIFGLPVASTQQVQLYDNNNTMPLLISAINDPSQSLACEQFAFDFPLVSTQQVQPYVENMMPFSTRAFNESTSVPSGIRSSTNEAINNQQYQDPRLATCSRELQYETLIWS